ncbi:variable surface lipoprotein [Mycoplasmopsis agalactiae]|uniref:variable surface lipoprotein n=1 Tax=Mycoplasmopsis agalactiae TaxID=2110 RepID=UPI001F19FC66|nr:variable surface lipoprotein [Mycoplasmopsis agalactiae]MCE6061929.1 variable surface lipoprotein [Mycoplasmopsis agalactiae]
MKKSKFLLLGSVASMAAIPFVAAKCGDTKEEENKKPAEMPGGGQKDPKAPAEGGMPADKDKTEKDKTETEKSDKDKSKEDKDKDKDKNTKIDLSKINTNLGYFPKDEKTKAVRQKDIKDKIVKLLNGRQDFSLAVDYDNHKAKVTLANGQEITFTFTDERERMAQDTDASGADINSGTRSVQPSGATQPGKPGASTQPSGSAQ